jgi:hypothetical protein
VHTVRCRITVSGVLGEADGAAFADFDIETSGTYSVLIGDVDQLKLHGVQTASGRWASGLSAWRRSKRRQVPLDVQQISV